MVFISIWLKLLLPARLNIVCSAVSLLPLTFVMWSSIAHLLLIVIPRYLYVSVLSIIMFPSCNLGSWFFNIVIVWLFSWPNVMLYLWDTSSVIASILCVLHVCLLTYLACQHTTSYNYNGLWLSIKEQIHRIIHSIPVAFPTTP